MRASLSIAMIDMVVPVKSNASASIIISENETVCPRDPKQPTRMARNSFTPYDASSLFNYRGNDLNKIQYDWSQELQGIILSSFYWGYLISQIPGGFLVQKFGGKSVLGVGIACCGVISLTTPYCIKIGKFQ